MAAERIYTHRPVHLSSAVPADGLRQTAEYDINFITLPGFGTDRRNTEYRHSRQAMFVVGYGKQAL